MTTETAENTIKRTKVMQPRYALLYRLSHNSHVFKYVRCNTAKPILMELDKVELDQIQNGDFTSLKDLETPKILGPLLIGIAYGSKLTEVPDEDAFNLLAEDVMVLEFLPGSKTPSAMKTLDNY